MQPFSTSVLGQSKMLSFELVLLKPCEHNDAPLYIDVLNTILLPLIPSHIPLLRISFLGSIFCLYLSDLFIVGRGGSIKLFCFLMGLFIVMCDC